MSEKIRDPMMELFMEIDGRIENAIEMIKNEEDIPEIDYKILITDKESLLEIYQARIGDPKDIQYEKIWANNLINKIDLIFDTNNKKL
jgi:hypothetical protein